MPVHFRSGNPAEYIPTSDYNRKYIIEDATVEARKQVETDYPYAVYRNQQEVTQHAQQVYREWIAYVQEEVRRIYQINKQKNQELSNHLGEIQRLYVSAFVGKYLEEVAKKDGTATPQPTASPTGARATVTKIDRSPDEYVYHLELTDPEYFDGIEKTEWVVYFEGASVPATEATSTTAAYGMASSDVAYGSATPQKTTRKPKGSYLRKPQ